MQSFLSYTPPLFLCTLIFITGILWQASNAGIYALAAIFIPLAFLLLHTSYRALVQPQLPWLIAAFAIGALRNTLNEYTFLRMAEQLCNARINISGTLVALEKTGKPSLKRAIIALDSYTKNGATHQLDQHLIQLSVAVPLQANVGDTIVVDHLFLKQQKQSTLATFFKKQGIIATGFVGKEQAYTVTPGTPTCRTWIQKKRDALLQKFETMLSPRTFLLVSSIFLGYKSVKNSTSDILYEQFQWWGISHYLARSGLHLVIFTFILHLLFMFIPLPFTIKQIAIGACITIYMVLSWTSVSFLRSLVMIFCYLVCALLQLQQHGLHTISVACCAILLYNPAFLFALDFQLSFGLTLALILLHWAQRKRTQTPAVS